MLDSTVHLFNSVVTPFPFLLAQVSDSEASGAVAIVYLFYLVLYVAIAFCQWKIFQKLGVENAWFAWIPILNYYVTYKAGDVDNPVLWTVLSFVPCVNLVSAVFLIIAWVKVCKKLNKTPWILLLCLTGIGAPFVFAYLAFAQ